MRGKPISRYRGVPRPTALLHAVLVPQVIIVRRGCGRRQPAASIYLPVQGFIHLFQVFCVIMTYMFVKSSACELRFIKCNYVCYCVNIKRCARVFASKPHTGSVRLTYFACQWGKNSWQCAWGCVAMRVRWSSACHVVAIILKCSKKIFFKMSRLVTTKMLSARAWHWVSRISWTVRNLCVTDGTTCRKLCVTLPPWLSSERLKTREWKTRDWKTWDQIAWV